MGGSPFWKELAVAFNRLLPDFVLVSFCKAREIKKVILKTIIENMKDIPRALLLIYMIFF